MTISVLRPARRARCTVVAIAITALIGPASGTLAAAGDGTGGGDQQQPAIDLTLASLEELMNIEITSASRKQERAADAAAAVDVLTSDDIRRSGLTTVPELLRLIPGVQVAQISAHDWAVSVRGFNDLFANKLLVLIDGRSIYTRIFAGVNWETHDLFVEDIDRIEVIRGPNAAVWGANAVNGVINIITRNTSATLGTFVAADAGSFGEHQVAARYGGERGDARYRVYSQFADYGSLQTRQAASAEDQWWRGTVGFRSDITRGRNETMVDGDVTRGREDQLGLIMTSPLPATTPVLDRPAFTLGHALARWTHTGRDNSTLEVQSYVDLRRSDSMLWTYSRNAFDAGAQYHRRVASRHDLLVGGGYRLEDEQLDGSFSYSITGKQQALTLANLFGQDEITAARDRLHVTVGARLEHDTFTGWGVQPNLRGIWMLTPAQHVWASVSRALRTPSIHDRALSAISSAGYDPLSGLPMIFDLRGSADFGAERVVSTEVGYRITAGTKAEVAVNSFFTRYRDVWTFEPQHYELAATPPPFHIVLPLQIQNTYAADTHGVEVSGHIVVMSGWRLDGGYTAYFLTSKPLAGTTNPFAADYDGNAPRHQAMVRTAVKPWGRAEFSATLARVGRLSQLQVPAYTRLDSRAEFSLGRVLSLAVDGQNLVGANHMEFGGFEQSAYARRTGSVRLTWRF